MFQKSVTDFLSPSSNRFSLGKLELQVLCETKLLLKCHKIAELQNIFYGKEIGVQTDTKQEYHLFIFFLGIMT